MWEKTMFTSEDGRRSFGILLKIENYCLKIYVEIYVGKKYVKKCVILFKNWKLMFKNTNQTPS